MTRFWLVALVAVPLVAVLLANPLQVHGQVKPPTAVGPLSGKAPATQPGTVAASGATTQPAVLKPLKLDLGNRVTMDLVLIPAGKFTMGTVKKTYNDNDEREFPHEVTISKPFFMGIYTVTQEQWKAMMGTQPWKGQIQFVDGNNYPAGYVNWADAVAFCKKLSAKTGKTVRLPTEAEWEYACRAGTTTRFSFGDKDADLPEYASLSANLKDPTTWHPYPVGQKKPNPWGLYDMHGNIKEWCSDWYHDSYGIVVDPKELKGAPDSFKKMRELIARMKVVDPQGPTNPGLVTVMAGGPKTAYRIARGGAGIVAGGLAGRPTETEFRSTAGASRPAFGLSLCRSCDEDAVVLPSGKRQARPHPDEQPVNKPTEQQIAQWYPRLLRTALRLTGSQTDAEDLTQEAVLRAWQSWPAFDGKCCPVTWIHRILVNCVRDWARRKMIRSAASLGEWDLPGPASGKTLTSDGLEQREQLDRLREEIALLPQDLREPFVAAVLDGHPYADVADMLTIPQGTVGYRVYEARRRLTAAMQGLFSETRHDC